MVNADYDDPRPIVAEIKITVRAGDKVRLRRGGLFRVVDKNLGGELVGRQRGQRYGAAFTVDNIIEWRSADDG